MLRLFGTKKATNLAISIDNMLNIMHKRHEDNWVMCTSEDLQSFWEGQWVDASDYATKQLSKVTKDRRMLAFYPGTHYEMSYNDGKKNFCQGQLAMLLNMPTAEDVKHFWPVHILLAPEGCKSFPSDTANRVEDLQATEGWRKCSIIAAPQNTHFIGKMQVK